jgi:hypothetical protein
MKEESRAIFQTVWKWQEVVITGWINEDKNYTL